MMNLVELQKKLVAAARLEPGSDRVPHAFERRVMARLRAAGFDDGWSLWAGALWRAALGSVAISILLSAWFLFPGHGSRTASNLTQIYDSTVLAAADQLVDNW